VRYPHYTWRVNHASLDYEVARWDNAQTHEVVQTNIKTLEKAREAVRTWQRREDIREAIKHGE
jgi:hypothetical protein